MFLQLDKVANGVSKKENTLNASVGREASTVTLHLFRKANISIANALSYLYKI